MSVERVKIYDRSGHLMMNHLACKRCFEESGRGYLLYPNRKDIALTPHDTEWNKKYKMQVIADNVRCSCQSIDQAHELHFRFFDVLPNLTVCSHLTRLSIDKIDTECNMLLPDSLKHLKLYCAKTFHFSGKFQLESFSETSLSVAFFEDETRNFKELKQYRAIQLHYDRSLALMPDLEKLCIGFLNGTIEVLPSKLKILVISDVKIPPQTLAKYIQESNSLEKLTVLQQRNNTSDMWQRVLEACSLSKSLKRLNLWGCEPFISLNDYSIVERVEAFAADVKDKSSLRRLFEKNNCIRQLRLPFLTLDIAEPVFKNFIRRRGAGLEELDADRLEGDMTCIKKRLYSRTEEQVLKEARRQRNASLVILIGKAFMAKDVSTQIAKEIKNFWE